MLIKLKHNAIQCFSMLLLMVSMSDANAASRQACNNAMILQELQELNFGDYDGTVGGDITVSTDGSRTSTGPNLAGGGTVSAGVFLITTGIAGCAAHSIKIQYTGKSTISGAGSDMTLSNFQSDPQSQTFSVGNAAGDSVSVNIGADLASPANQTTGPYTGSYNAKFTFVK